MTESDPSLTPADDGPIDRREFGRHVAIGAIVGGLSTGAANGAADAQEPPPVEKPVEPPAPEPPDAADHLLEALALLHPLPTEPEQRAVILDDLRGIIGRSQALASYPFTNADEPAPIFGAWRAKEQQP